MCAVVLQKTLHHRQLAQTAQNVSKRSDATRVLKCEQHCSNHNCRIKIAVRFMNCVFYDIILYQYAGN